MEEPKATNKHTLCGYSWSDVTTALVKAIGSGDMVRAQRWAAELVCSDLGLGRLEATLLHAWAIHVNSMLPAWCRLWYTSIEQIRAYWSKSGGDIKAVRNTPVVRQIVAEAVAMLVLAAKKPLPAIPTSADVFREAEAMRVRLRVGGSGDQRITRLMWTAASDGVDLKTIGNELEAALRTNQMPRVLFWIVWILTLESQTDAPSAKERGPGHLSIKQRKSLFWYVTTLFHEMCNEFVFLSVADREGMFRILDIVYVKLGSKGKRDILAAIALCILNHNEKRNTLTLTAPNAPPSSESIRASISTIDTIYSSIAAEAKRYMLEAPSIVGLTAEAKAAMKQPRSMPTTDKLQLAFSLTDIRR